MTWDNFRLQDTEEGTTEVGPNQLKWASSAMQGCAALLAALLPPAKSGDWLDIQFYTCQIS